jgi:glycopeptide antibiotics resistance protein
MSEPFALNLKPGAWNLEPLIIRHSGVLFLAVLLIIITAGLWPFNFIPKNKVKWLPDRNGVHFYGHGIIISSDPLRLAPDPSSLEPSITIELHLRPLIETSNLPRILTLYDGKTPDIFFVGQWRSHLDIQSRTDNPAMRKKGKAYGETGLMNALLKNQDVLITVISGKNGTNIYMNGNFAAASPRHSLLSDYKGQAFHIILGNSSTGKGYWTGEFLGLAIYNTTLTPEQISANHLSWLKSDFSSIKQAKSLIALYPFKEREGIFVNNRVGASAALSIPKIFQHPKQAILEPPWQDFYFNGSFITDAIINILGFIPLGLITCTYLLNIMPYLKRKNTTYLIVFIFCCSLTFSIELLQIYLPSRQSQLGDVLFNTLGTILGIAVYHAFTKMKLNR